MLTEKQRDYVVALVRKRQQTYVESVAYFRQKLEATDFAGADEGVALYEAIRSFEVEIAKLTVILETLESLPVADIVVDCSLKSENDI